MDAQEKLEAARMLVRMHWPYLADRVRAFRPVPSPGLQKRHGKVLVTTQRNTMLYDPEGLEAWTPAQVAAVLTGKEAMHQANKHAMRAAEYGTTLDLEEWQTACNAAINEVTQSCMDFIGAEWPEGLAPTDPKTLDLEPGQVAEQHYEVLMGRKPKKEPKPDEPGDGDGPGKDPGDQPGPGNGDSPGPGGDPGSTDSQGNPLPPEDAALDQEHGQDPGDTERDDDKMRDAVAKAHERGLVPASMRRLVPVAKPVPRINWRHHLRKAVRGAVKRTGMSDLTWSKPNRNQAAAGYAAIMPAWIGRTPKVGVYVDTSGSMNGPLLAAAGKQLDEILSHVKVPTMVTSCDAQIHGSGMARSFAEAQAKGLLVGGGGTSFQPIMDHLRRLPAQRRPSLAIVLTDGYGDAPAKPPGIEVIWVVIASDYCSVPWGTKVFVKGER